MDNRESLDGHTQTIAGQQTDNRWIPDRQYMYHIHTIDGQHTENRYIKLEKQMQADGH